MTVFIAALLVAFAFAVLPVGAAYAATTSQLTVTSEDTSGTTISGYYTILYQGGNVVSTGFTPATFTLTDGQSYVVQVDNYGSCNFVHWSDGNTDASVTVTISTNAMMTAEYNCTGSSGGSGSSLSVSSVNQYSTSMTGYYTILHSSAGSVLGTGFTPATFSTTSGTSYSVQVDNYGNCSFTNWSDGVTSNPRSFTATGSTLSLTALYTCKGATPIVWTTPGETGHGAGTITIYDHRIPAGYWADCFATACTNPQSSCDTSCTGPGASMWVVLYNSDGTVVATGFADEHGLTFSGLSPSATYYLDPSDCDLCHNSTHDVLFSNWANLSTTRPLPVLANGSYYDAWYTCTNGCGGGV